MAVNRFEPGETKSVPLVDIAGRRVVSGGNDLAPGPVRADNAPEILRSLERHKFAHKPQKKRRAGAVATMTRSHYASIFGPTTGDLVRLGDTGLVVEVEHDFAIYGDECKFGGGKVLRDGMGQASGVAAADALDCVLTNAVRLCPPPIRARAHHRSLTPSGAVDRGLHGRLQGRHWHQERSHRWNRKGWKP